ncbi:MAG: hypothetical protein GY927_22500 [bacterium]|nr:hypothetical protein [bacterium]
MKVLMPADKNQNVTIKIPYPLYKDIQEFKTELKKVEPNLTFNISKICAESLETFLKAARKELDNIKKDKSYATESQEEMST